MLGSIVMAHVILAGITIYVIFRLDFFELQQAILQSVTSLIIPFVGSVLILVLQSVVYKNMTKKMQPDRPNPNSKDEDASSLLNSLD